MHKLAILIPILWILLLAGCSEVNIVEQEIEELAGIRSERIFTYKINPLPDELPDENRMEFLNDWIEEREFYSEELLEYDGFGNLILREFTIPETDSFYQERYTLSSDLTLVEIETRINGSLCEDCQPDKIERELDALVQPVRELVHQGGQLLHENIISYAKPGDVHSIRRNLSPGGNELYTEIFSYIARDARTNVVRTRRKFFKEEDRILTTEFGYDLNGFLARMTEVEELPFRQVIWEHRYINLVGDDNRNWVSRIKDGIWLEERLIDYY